MKNNSKNHFNGTRKGISWSVNLKVLIVALMSAVITITAALPITAGPNAATPAKTVAVADHGYWTGYWTWTGTMWYWTWVWVPDTKGWKAS